MAWRPSSYLIEGTFDNTTPGRVTGTLRFAGLSEPVALDLEGNFHRDLRGAKVRLHPTSPEVKAPDDASAYFDGFALRQTGRVGDMTAGLPPADYVDYPYFEWYGDANGRVVLELEPDQVTLLSPPIPAAESDPIDPRRREQLFGQFLASVAEAAGASPKAPAVVEPSSNRPDPVSDPEDPDDMSVVFTYSRAEALADGVLVDLTGWATDLGFRDPVACTQAVWADYLVPPTSASDGHGQSERGRTHDLLWMLRVAIQTLREEPANGRMPFDVQFVMDTGRTETVTLHAYRGPGDQGESVLTVMMPHED